MSEEKTLVPVEQREIDFYGDEITAVLVEEGDRQMVFIPIRPICDYLGLNWSGQRQRIQRDPILGEVSSECVIHSQGQGRRMLCLPLDYLNGWMFSINADRVKEDIRNNLLRYQRDCYRALADAFLLPMTAVSAVDSDEKNLVQLHNMALVIAATTKEMLETKRLAKDNERRLDAAREYLRGINQRLKTIEQRTQAGTLTEEQAREIQHRVNLIAKEMAKADKSKQHHQGIYETLRHETGATSYKYIPMKAYEAAIEFLDGWLDAVAGAEDG